MEMLPAIYRQYPLPTNGKRAFPRAVLKHGVFHEGQPKVRAFPLEAAPAAPAASTASGTPQFTGILRVYAYFIESVPAAVGEFTVRKLTLFVKQGSREVHRQSSFLSSSPETEVPKLVISAFEEHLPNSGLPQGKFLHEVPFPDELSLDDFRVGNVINFFGRRMRIYDMDSYTREVLGDASPAEVPIEDAHAFTLKHVQNSSASILSQIRPTCLPALELSRKAKAPEMGISSKSLECLRTARPLRFGPEQEPSQYLVFHGLWNSTNEPFGQMLEVEIRCFPGHIVPPGIETPAEIEVILSNEEFTGVLFKKILSRQRVPYNPEDIDAEGRIRDPVGILYAAKRFYRPEDFKIGNTVTIFGRRIRVINATEKARKYLLEACGTYGDEVPEKGVKKTDDFPAAGIPLSAATASNDTSNGYAKQGGQFADIPASANLSMSPGPSAQALHSRTETQKSVATEQQIKADETPQIPLEFLCKLDLSGAQNPAREERIHGDRLFVVSLRLTDGAICVTERFTFNDGMDRRFSGKVLSFTTSLKNPATNEPYKAVDFTIGESIRINGILYKIDSASTCTMQYLEELQ